jgi:hypothetical protein
MRSGPFGGHRAPFDHQRAASTIIPDLAVGLKALRSDIDRPA